MDRHAGGAQIIADALEQEGQLMEQVLTKSDLQRADAILFLNALRGCLPARLI
jgi:branched-subunit amino acid aminotransferase/4-amino-4-deoxychorismate lyase